MMIDVGSVLKGIAVDRAQKKLHDYNIKKALITTGSSTTLMDRKPDGGKWLVGIQHPRKLDDLLGVLTGSNVTISTSGDYQQYFYKNGKRYNHIINPKTGYPQDEFMSVTVISPVSAAQTDILSTAIFAMGIDKGLSFAEKQGVEYIAVSKKGKVFKSRKIDKYLDGRITY